MTARQCAEQLTVVVIDDDSDHLELIRTAIASAPLGSPDVQTFSDPSVALADLPVSGQTVILCDYRLPATTGLDWLGDFIRADVGPVILLSSSGDERIASAAFRGGASDYLAKEAIFDNPDRLAGSIREALRRWKLEHTNRDLARRLKLANAELEHKNEALAELTATAHRFVDDVAHDFRTPLAVIREFASILADGIGGPITPKQAEFLRFVSDATRDLATLVDDFLDSGKLRAKTLRVDRHRATIAEIVDGLWPMLEMRASAKSVRLRRELAPGLPDVLADVEKSRRVLSNLVVNAIKFSPHESEVCVSADALDEGGVSIAVSDHGPGLDPEAQELLFKRFEQGENASIGKGFGLGLAIARELTRLNLGTIDVDSALGEGSTFSFTLPPFDFRIALDWHLRRLTETDRTAVSMLRVVPVSGADLEDVRSGVVAICHPMDLAIVNEQGRCLTLIGDTAEPLRWRARLLERWTARLRPRARPEDAPPAIEVIGTWPIDQAQSEITARIFPRAKKRELAHSA